VQSLCSSLDSGEFEFTGHDWHTSATAPTAVEYCAAKQLLHGALPLCVLYLPATQAAHSPPSGPVNPALQVQSVCSLLATGALEFNGHATHTSDMAAISVEYLATAQFVHRKSPRWGLYFPASHSEHALPLGPLNPALQSQSFRLMLAVGACVFAGQF